MIVLIPCVSRAVVGVLVKPASGSSGPAERYMESVICSVCETCIRTALHPHTAVSITLQIEHNAGAVSCPLFVYFFLV